MWGTCGLALRDSDQSGLVRIVPICVTTLPYHLRSWVTQHASSSENELRGLTEEGKYPTRATVVSNVFFIHSGNQKDVRLVFQRLSNYINKDEEIL